MVECVDDWSKRGGGGGEPSIYMMQYGIELLWSSNVEHTQTLTSKLDRSMQSYTNQSMSNGHNCNRTQKMENSIQPSKCVHTNPSEFSFDEKYLKNDRHTKT